MTDKKRAGYDRDKTLAHPLYREFMRAHALSKGRPRVEVEFSDMRCPDDPEFDPNLREMKWVEDTIATIGLFLEAADVALANAWDEGFSRATGSINSDDQFDNPYREDNR